MKTNLRAMSRSLALTVMLTTGGAVQGAPIPGEGAWQTGVISNPAKEGIDRIFLVNRQWIEGRLTKIDATAVTFEMDGQVHTFPRSDVSVLQLGDWLSPEKRPDKQEVKVRIVCDGTAEAGTLLFTRGTIISKVDAPPKFTSGQDADDRISADRTSIEFEKGTGDRSATSFTADLTLLVPVTDALSCELMLARANGFAGPLQVRFLNPADGKELVVLSPAKEFWNRFDIPLAKLKAGAAPSKVACIPSSEVTVRNIQAIPPLPAPSTSKDTTAARLCLVDSQVMAGRLQSLDQYSVRMQIGISQAILIPRGKIACIELNDWEINYRGVKPAENLTAPLTVSFAGPSATSYVTLPTTESIARLIAPPHFVSGSDRNDVASVNSDRSFGFEKTVIDRSPSQVEATLVFRSTSKQGTEIGVSNAYTNVWAGDLRVSLFDALTKRPLETSGSSTPSSLSFTMKLGRAKLITP